MSCPNGSKQIELRFNKEGLPVIKDKKPWLIVGSILKKFLEDRNTARKHPLRFGEFFCVGCKQPRPPAGEMTEYQTSSTGSPLMSAICPLCEKMMKLRVSVSSLKTWECSFEVKITSIDRNVQARPLPTP